MPKRRDISDLPNISTNHLENYFEVNTDELGNRYYDLTDTVFIDTENMNPTFFHTHDIQENDELMSLSNKYYGEHNLWWTIASANNMDDPFDLRVGETLKIPKKDILGRIIDIITTQQ